MDPIKLQIDIHNNQSDLEGFVNDLDSWSREMKQKEAQRQTSVTSGEKRQNQSTAVDRSVTSDVHKLKESGNSFLKRREYQKAVKQYSEAMLLDSEYAVLPANRAMAYIKLKEFASAVRDCDTAIALDSGYVKAYLRRGTAREHLGELSSALQDFATVLEMEPNNTEAKQATNRIRSCLPAKSVVINGGNSHRPKKSSDTQPVKQNKSSLTPNTAPSPVHPNPPLLDIAVKHLDNDTQLDAFIDSVLHSGPGCGTAAGETRAPHVSRNVTNAGQNSVSTVVSADKNVSSSSVQSGSTVDDSSVVVDKPATRCATVDDSSVVVDKPASRCATVDKCSVAVNGSATRGTTVNKFSSSAHESNTRGAAVNKSSVVDGSATVGAKAGEFSATGNEVSAAGSGDAHPTISCSLAPPGGAEPLPPVPATSYQLLADWRCLSGDQRRVSRYLLAIPGRSLPELFSHSLDARLLASFVQCMSGWSLADAADRLAGLARVPRVDTIVMFLEPTLRRSLGDTVRRCQKIGLDVGGATRFV